MASENHKILKLVLRTEFENLIVIQSYDQSQRGGIADFNEAKAGVNCGQAK